VRKSENQEQSPAFQFYAGDWISDPNRLKMSLDEQGAYVLLYCHCWRGKSIEFDWEILSRLCNCRLDKIKKIWHLFLLSHSSQISSKKAIFLCVIYTTHG